MWQNVPCYAAIVEELLDNELRTYKKLYLKDRNIQYVLLVGSYVHDLEQYMQKNGIGREIDRETFLKFYENHVRKGERELAQELGVSNENGGQFPNPGHGDLQAVSGGDRSRESHYPWH